MGVGMPTILLLQDFGEHVYRAFGHMSYHVGSSLRDKAGWRDVDVRLLLPDDEYARMELGDPDRPHDNARWVSIVMAWSAFGKQLTGLPIDFQIQPVTYANAKFSRKDGCQRSALFRIDEARLRQDLIERAVERVRREQAEATSDVGADVPGGGAA